MPELPEVETVAQGLRTLLVGRVLLQACNTRAALRTALPAWETVVSQRIAGVTRHGKYLLIAFANHITCVAHLGMSGRFQVQTKDSPLAPHTHVRWWLDNEIEIRYLDPRRFGFFHLHAQPIAQVPAQYQLGPDPLQPAFSLQYLQDQLRSRRRDLKSVLLDQQVLAGVGNIYASEALFVAGLSPFRSAATVSATESERLHAAVREVLQAAITHGGTTLSKTGYMDIEGRPGTHQQTLHVYGREGQPCPRCQQPLRRDVQTQRSTYFCALCQT